MSLEQNNPLVTPEPIVKTIVPGAVETFVKYRNLELSAMVALLVLVVIISLTSVLSALSNYSASKANAKTKQILLTIQTNQLRSICVRNLQIKYFYDFAGVFNTPLAERGPQLDAVRKDAIAWQNSTTTCK